MTDENNTEPIEEVPQDNSNDDLKETLKKRLELELGLPLTPKTVKQVDMKFNDNVILLDDFPVIEVKLIKINSNEIASEDYILVENEGAIYLNETCSGRLYVEYTYGLSEEELEAERRRKAEELEEKKRRIIQGTNFDNSLRK